MLLSGYLVEFAALSLCLLLAANFTPLGFTPLRLAASFHLVSHFHGCYEMVALTATTCELRNRRTLTNTCRRAAQEMPLTATTKPTSVCYCLFALIRSV